MTETGHDALDVICDLLLAEDLGISQVTSGPAAATLPLFVAHPVGMVGTDSTFLGDKPSPRTYGSFPRILGQFVRDEALLSLEEAVRKMTSAPAARLGLRDRGVIRDGAVADLVVFDPATVRSTATYDEPRSYPVGIEQVIVAGTLVVADGAHTGATPGRGLRDGSRLSAQRARRDAPRSWTGGGPVRSMSFASRIARRCSANIRSWARATATARLESGTGTRPADREVERDRARLEPQVAGLADALDVVDRHDLVRLREEDPEPCRADPRQLVGTARIPAERVGQGGKDAVARLRSEVGDETVEPVELDDHDGRRVAVAVHPGILVGHDPVPLLRDQQAGQRVRSARGQLAPERRRDGRTTHRWRPAGARHRCRATRSIDGRSCAASSARPRP